MSIIYLKFPSSASNLISSSLLFLTVILFVTVVHTNQQQKAIKAPELLTLDLYHKFDLNQDFKLRGSILIKSLAEIGLSQVGTINQAALSEEDLQALKRASDIGESYYLKSSLRKKKGDSSSGDYSKTTQTLVKACSLFTSNLSDTITVNLSPQHEFVSVNLQTSDPECIGKAPDSLSERFETSVRLETSQTGPGPDTATYIKRLEEERQSKVKEGKEDNRSFFAKYWIYIVPAVIILMIFSGPEQGGR